MNCKVQLLFIYQAAAWFFICSCLLSNPFENSPGASFAAKGGPERSPIIFGFYVNWDRASWDSLRQNITSMTHVAPVWLHLEDGQGRISLENDPEVERLARKARVPLVPLINNFKKDWRPDHLHQVLQDPGRRRRLVDSISARLLENGYAGINIDFEQLEKRDRESMVEFMKILYAELHAKGLLVTQSVPVDDDAYDLKRLSQYNDFIIPMLYDEHFDTGRSGPIASQPWFEKMFRQTQSLIPSRKLLAGLGCYGYDWVAGSKKAASVNVTDIMKRARERGAELSLPDRASNPFFSYVDAKGRHEVWFLDATTLSQQWAYARDYNIPGLALWRLGSEDPNVWKLLARLSP